MAMTNNSYNNNKYNSDHKTDTQVIISNTIHLLPHYYRGGGLWCLFLFNVTVLETHRGNEYQLNQPEPHEYDVSARAKLVTSISFPLSNSWIVYADSNVSPDPSSKKGWWVNNGNNTSDETCYLINLYKDIWSEIVNSEQNQQNSPHRSAEQTEGTWSYQVSNCAGTPSDSPEEGTPLLAARFVPL